MVWKVTSTSILIVKYMGKYGNKYLCKFSVNNARIRFKYNVQQHCGAPRALVLH